MNRHSGRNFDNNEGKTIAAVISMAGILVAAGLLSALYLVGSYQQPVIAQQQQQQQNNTGGPEASTGNQASSVTTTNDTITSTAAGITEGGNTTNATTTTGAGGVPLGGNQSEIRVQLEEAVMALQNNDTESALMHLDLALNALGMTANNTIVGSSVNTTGSGQESILALVEESTSVDEDNDDGTQDGNNNNNDNDESEGSAADGSVDGGNNAAQSTTSSTDADSQETNTEDGEASECGAVNIGGTSPADDYGCPPDPDA